MPGFKWIYLEGEGVQHHVELFHGRLKGHVLITCNSDILFTDFNVRQSKTYTFFINQELCKIHLKRSGLKFVYTFEIDKKADTPLNQMRRKRESRYNVYTVLLVLGLAIPVVGAIFYNKKLKAKKETGYEATDSLLSSNELYNTSGKIFRKGDRFFIQAVFGGLIYELDIPQPYSKVGWPVEEGQEYDVQLSGAQLKVDWERPSTKTLEVFRDRVMARLDYELFASYGYTDRSCLDELVQSYTKAYGLACFYHCEVSPEVNPQANSKKFEALLNSEEMKNSYKQVCTNSL